MTQTAYNINNVSLNPMLYIYIKEKNKNHQVLQILFGVTGKYNPVYQHSKGNMKRIVAELNDFDPLALVSFHTRVLSEAAGLQTQRVKLREL